MRNRKRFEPRVGTRIYRSVQLGVVKRKENDVRSTRSRSTSGRGSQIIKALGEVKEG